MNIVAAVDFSPVTERMLTTLERIAAALPARVWLIHVAPPDPDFVGYGTGPDTVRSQVAGEHRARHQQLQHLADRLRSAGVDVTALLVQGQTVATVLAQTKHLAGDLLVLGSHGHGAVYDLVVGSVSEGVVRAARVPVLLVPSRE